MSSLHLVDPELRQLLEFFPKLDFATADLPTIRLAIAGLAASGPGAVGDAVQVSEHRIAGPAGAPPVRVLATRPKRMRGTLPAILHLHPGGYVLGSADMLAPADAALAEDLGCAVFAVDYRLAPETRHPGPIEDCYAALRWLHANAAALHIDRDRIGVLGESAGGGLAATLALLARDRGEVALAFQNMVAPTLDDRCCVGPASSPFVGEFVWTREQSAFCWSALLGIAPGSPGVSAYAAAARADDLAGLPPAFIAVGALDRLAGEALAYATRLTEAGVSAELHLFAGAFHGFDASATARVALEAAAAGRAAMRRAFGN